MVTRMEWRLLPILPGVPIRRSVAMQGFGETVMSPARRRRRRRFITAVVDIVTGQILDVFDGRDAADLRRWLASRPRGWLDGVEVVSLDPHEGYRSAVTGNALLDAILVVDPFHSCGSPVAH